MPDLPNVGWERDVESFTEFFENPAFRTDGLKLYPTLVIRGTGLYELWKAGLYRNYDPALLVELVSLEQPLEGFAKIDCGCHWSIHPLDTLKFPYIASSAAPDWTKRSLS